MSIAFIPKSLANEIAYLSVLYIYICAEPPTAIDPSGSSAIEKTNHWVLHLAISPTEAIQLDPSPNSENTMTLIVSRKDNVCAHNAIQAVRLDCVEDLTAGAIVEYLRSKKYIQYEFSSTGQGCRYWLSSLLTLLCVATYVVDSFQVAEAAMALKIVWDEHGKARDEEQTGVVAGKFY